MHTISSFDFISKCKTNNGKNRGIILNVAKKKRREKKDPAKNKMFNNFEIFPLLPSLDVIIFTCMLHIHIFMESLKLFYDESLKGDIERCQNLSSIIFFLHIFHLFSSMVELLMPFPFASHYVVNVY